MLFGPPGSGKGTFAQFAKMQGYEHFSAGDAIRKEITNKTPFGLAVEKAVREGRYAQRELLWTFLKQKVQELPMQNRPCILDGFGRTEEDFLQLITVLTDWNVSDRVVVFFLEASDEICKERILTRLVCSKCRRIYNSQLEKVLEADDCPACLNGSLEVRINDTPETVQKRLADYRKDMSKSKQLLEIFPSFSFRSDQDELTCLAFYQLLLEQIEKFEGNSRSLACLLEHFKNK